MKYVILESLQNQAKTPTSTKKQKQNLKNTNERNIKFKIKQEIQKHLENNKIAKTRGLDEMFDI
jgi:hypothetical protein